MTVKASFGRFDPATISSARVGFAGQARVLPENPGERDVREKQRHDFLGERMRFVRQHREEMSGCREIRQQFGNAGKNHGAFPPGPGVIGFEGGLECIDFRFAPDAAQGALAEDVFMNHPKIRLLSFQKRLKPTRQLL